MLALRDDMLALLRECLKGQRPDLLYVIDSEELITLDDNLGNELREAALDEFLRIGLNPDNVPNEVGVRLETLIDHIGRLFM